MSDPFYLQIFWLAFGIGLIIYLTSAVKVHPFFVLLLVSVIIGLSAGFPALEVLTLMKEGFGQILKSLGFIIVLGITLGILLERSGSTTVLAQYVVKRTGAQNSALAMAITGFFVGLPIFCDSGFIVLSGLSLSLASRSGVRVIIPAVSLATGLYSVHCLIPPHPGASAAAGLLGVSFGKVIAYGIIAAIPAMLAGYFWSRFAGARYGLDEPPVPANEGGNARMPSVLQSALPVIMPISLIALKSFLLDEKSTSTFDRILAVAGEPAVALLVGVVICLGNFRPVRSSPLRPVLSDAVEKSGNILLIIGAGASFGAVLAATRIGDSLKDAIPLGELGLLFPFLLAAVLKTAQGSSTVAIITTASIVEPLLSSMGLDSETGRLWSVLAMGAGSMILSHANDSYFWVILNFQKLTMGPMLKVYSVATVFMGIVSFICIYIMSLLL